MHSTMYMRGSIIIVHAIIERVLKVKALILLDMHIIALIDGCWPTRGYALALGQSCLVRVYAHA